MAQQKSEDRVVLQGGVMPGELVGSSPDGRGKAVPVDQTAVQLELPIATAEHRTGSRTGPGMGRVVVPKAIVNAEIGIAVTMEEVAKRLTSALLKVVLNKGAPGPDGQTVEALVEQWPIAGPRLQADLLDGTYRPGVIRGAMIPKAGGGQRGLGIPDVIDRMVCEAVRQVLEPCWEPTFHASSHGFRPGRSCHTAITEATQHLQDRHEWVVDIDLEKFLCRRDFIEAWTSLDTALSGGLHITNDEEKAMIAVGADTHKERHYAVALDQVGQLLAELSFAATAAGYAELQLWAERLVDGRGVVFGRRVLSMRARSTATLEERIAFSVMRDLAGHSRTVGADAKGYEHRLADLIRSLDDTLLEEPGIGPISAAKLLAFDPTRFPSEGAFARSNGTAPIPASSRKRSATDSTAAATAKPTTRSTPSRSSAPSTNPKPAPTSTAASEKARPHEKHSAHSSVTSPASSTTGSTPSLDFIEASLTRGAGDSARS